MARVLLAASDLRSLVAEVRAATPIAEGILQNVESLIDSLMVSFEGDAAEAYEAAIRSWLASAVDLLRDLGSLAGFLDMVAGCFQEVDEAIAQSMGGGGSTSDRVIADEGFLWTMSSRVQGLAMGLESYDASFDAHGFRSDDIGDALRHFRRSWSDARSEMVELLQGASEIAARTAELFREADVHLSRAVADAGS